MSYLAFCSVFDTAASSSSATSGRISGASSGGRFRTGYDRSASIRPAMPVGSGTLGAAGFFFAFFGASPSGGASVGSLSGSTPVAATSAPAGSAPASARRGAARGEQLGLLGAVLAVGERQVVRLARRERDGDAHEARPQRVDLERRAGLDHRLGVDRHGAAAGGRLARPGDEPLERLHRVDRFVADRLFRPGLDVGAEVERRVAAAVGERRRRPRRGPGRRVALRGLPRERGELELHVELLEPLAVGLAQPHRVEVERHREVGLDGDELLRQHGVVAVREQRLARALGLDLLDVGEDRLQRPELGDERLRPLSPIPFTPGTLSLASPTSAR
jgi:hypothetical protein